MFKEGNSDFVKWREI